MLKVSVSDEFGALQTVVMRYAGPFTLDLSSRHQLDPVHRRQLETSQWDQYDDTIVRAQQDAFMAVLRGRGVEVLLADQVPGCYGQHYTRDLGFVVDDVFVVSRLNSAKRQAEFSGMRALVERFSTVAYLDAGTIEGGDVMLHEGCVLVGLSEESSLEGVDALRYRLDQLGIGREVIAVPFTRSGVVHLDDHFNIVAPRVALVNPAVFAAAQMRWFEKHFDLIQMTAEEVLSVEVNTLALAPGVVAVAARSDRLAEELAARGIEPLLIDYSEVTRIPGSFRCSTLPLSRVAM